jgi:hypothetical protein
MIRRARMLWQAPHGATGENGDAGPDTQGQDAAIQDAAIQDADGDTRPGPGTWGGTMGSTAGAVPSSCPTLETALAHGPDGRSGDRLTDDSPFPGRSGMSGRCRRQTFRGAPRQMPRKADSRRFVALFDCKFATLNQLFECLAGTEPNWSGVRLSFMDKVASIASAESRRAVAGGRFGTVSCVEIGTKIDVRMQVRRRQGTAGVGDVLNEARARW